MPCSRRRTLAFQPANLAAATSEPSRAMQNCKNWPQASTEHLRVCLYTHCVKSEIIIVKQQGSCNAITDVLTNVKCHISDNDKSGILVTIRPSRTSLTVDLRNHNINENFKFVSRAFVKGSNGWFARGEMSVGVAAELALVFSVDCGYKPGWCHSHPTVSEMTKNVSTKTLIILWALPYTIGFEMSAIFSS